MYDPAATYALHRQLTQDTVCLYSAVLWLQPGTSYLLRTLDLNCHYNMDVGLHKRYHQLAVVLRFLQEWEANQAQKPPPAHKPSSRSYSAMLENCRLSALGLADVGPFHNLGDHKEQWAGLLQLVDAARSTTPTLQQVCLTWSAACGTYCRCDRVQLLLSAAAACVWKVLSLL